MQGVAAWTYGDCGVEAVGRGCLVGPLDRIRCVVNRAVEAVGWKLCSKRVKRCKNL